MKYIDEKSFDERQLLEIKKGKKHGLSKKEILLYANPNFDNYKMKLFRKALENGLPYKLGLVITSSYLDYYQILPGSR